MGDGGWGMAVIPHPLLRQQLLEPVRVELAQAFARSLAHRLPECLALGKLLACRESLSVNKYFEQVMEMCSVRDSLPAFPFENASPADANQLAQLGLSQASLIAERDKTLANLVGSQLVVMPRHPRFIPHCSGAYRAHHPGRANVNKWELVCERSSTDKRIAVVYRYW